MGVATYDVETRRHYDTDRARVYDQQITGFTWMRFATWLEARIVRRLLTSFKLDETDLAIDMPCGTGLLGSVFAGQRCGVMPCDISRDMIRYARNNYRNANLFAMVQGDLAQIPFPDNHFDFVVSIGLMHRVPREIRGKFLSELSRIAKRDLIASYSVDTPVQRLKQWLIKLVWRSHISASDPTPWPVIKRELQEHELEIVEKFTVAPLASAEIILHLRKTSCNSS